MVDATLLPFQFAAGVNAPRRTGSSTPGASASGGFANAMDGALIAERPARRTDTASRAPRRPDPARPREVAKHAAPATSRRAANPGRPHARQAERADATREDAPAERDADSCSSDSPAAADQSETPRLEAKASGDATNQPGATAADAVDTAVDEAQAAAVAAAATVPVPGAGEDDSELPSGDDPLARGRRWTTAEGAPANGQGDAKPNAAARGTAGTPSTAAKSAGAVPQEQIEDAAAAAKALADLAQGAAGTGKDGGKAIAGATSAATQAVAKSATTESAAAAATQKTAAADAATAVENALPAVETIAGAAPSSGTGTGGSETQQQAQHKAPAPQTVIEAAVTPPDGVRFTVNTAAGTAAYASAAPRHEENVLPQIVQSLRLHAVQGTTEARVQLKPEHLGALNITLKVEQNQVTATIQADVAAVRKWIESNEASLREALSEHGLHLARLVVHPDGQSASDEERNAEQQRRQPRRRSWRDEEATFEVLA